LGQRNFSHETSTYERKHFKEKVLPKITFKTLLKQFKSLGLQSFPANYAQYSKARKF